MTIALRPADQLPAVEALRASLRQHQFTLLRAPTGFGKTVVATYMVREAAAKRRRVIVAVHRRELALQTARTLRAFGIEFGFIMAGCGYTPARVQIASAQTLARRPSLAKCDLVIPDEAHLWASKTREELLRTIKQSGAYGVGLSATPERLDGKPLDIFDDLVLGPDEAWLMAHGYLSQYRAYAPVQADLTGLHKRGGDYASDEVAERLDKPAIVGDAVSHYLRLARGLRCLVFAVSRDHGAHLRDAYRASGVPAFYIDGDMDDDERRREIVAFADAGGVLINVQLCVEGFDLSSYVGRDVPIEAVSLQNPSASLARIMQMVGRALRPKPLPAVIMDHVNALVTHGFPDDPRAWSLAGRTSRPSVTATEVSVSVRVCEGCFAAFRPAPVCPYCGRQQAPQPRQVQQVDGDLEEIDRDRERAHRQREVQRARGLAELAALAVERGYKTGWLMQVSKSRNVPVAWPVAEAAMREARRVSTHTEPA